MSTTDECNMQFRTTWSPTQDNMWLFEADPLDLQIPLHPNGGPIAVKFNMNITDPRQSFVQILLVSKGNYYKLYNMRKTSA